MIKPLVDKEEFKPSADLHDAWNDAIKHGNDEQHGDEQRTDGTASLGIGILLEIIYQRDGWQAKKVQKVDSDGETGEIEDEHKPTVGVGLVGMVFPFEDEPKDQGGEHGGIGIDLAFNG